MAIYHLAVSAVQRSKGRSAVAAAAYRAGVRLVDERTGEPADYTRRRGVVWSGLVLPEGAPSWDRSKLWNAAEAAERRKDGTPAREVEIALPYELSEPRRRALAVAFAQRLAQVRGCAVDVAIHAPAGDERNHHAHLLMTTRELGPDGLGEKCAQEKAGRNRQADLEQLRGEWAQLCNKALEHIGSAERIDHRSHQARGLDAAPGLHLGPTATAIERAGQVSERGRWARAWQSFEARLMDYVSRITASLGQLRRAQRGEDRKMSKLHMEAFAEGAGARADGREIEDNPHQGSQSLAQAWRDGWDECDAFANLAHHRGTDWQTAADSFAVRAANDAAAAREKYGPKTDRAAELERLLEAHQETPAAPLQGDPFAGIEDEHNHHQEAGPRPGK